MNKSAQGKHWYNNLEKEGYFLECPEGWIKGRLPTKESTRKKMSENNGMKKLTEEQKAERSKKLKEYHENMSVEDKLKLSNNISKGRKGKGLGNVPWNKNKKGIQEAWNKGKNLAKESKLKISLTKQGKSEKDKKALSLKLSKSLKGRLPWNKGIQLGEWSEEKKALFLKKQNKTKTQNNSFNASLPEKEYEAYLKLKHGEKNVLCQYSDERYPFACDFYIKSLDLFIELNLTWTHGGHLFNKEDKEDLLLLERWQVKAETSDYYKNAIYTWTDLDIRKDNAAKQNKLNYKVIYKKGDLYND